MKFGMAFVSALLITGATSIAATQSGNTGQGSGQQGSGQGGQAQGGQRGTAPGQTGAATGNRELFLQRGERVVGVDVADSAGGSLGRVDDVVILSTGEIGYVVLQAPGEGGSKQYPIPWSQMHTQPPTVGGTGAPASGDAAGSQKLKVGFGKDRLKSAPSFEGNQWPKEGTTTVFSNADTFYGEGAGSATDASGMSNKGRVIDASALKMGSFRLTQIKGLQVVDGTGSPVGTIDQVVVDPVDGRVNYIAVKLTAPAANGRVIAMPWSALRVTRQDDKTSLQSTMSSDMLMKAPEFKTGDESWKQMSEPRWVNDLYSYYSVKPYWSTTPSSAAPKGTGAEKPKTPDDKKTPPDEKKKTPPDDKDPH